MNDYFNFLLSFSCLGSKYFVSRFPHIFRWAHQSHTWPTSVSTPHSIRVRPSKSGKEKWKKGSRDRQKKKRERKWHLLHLLHLHRQTRTKIHSFPVQKNERNPSMSKIKGGQTSGAQWLNAQLSLPPKTKENGFLTQSPESMTRVSARRHDPLTAWLLLDPIKLASLVLDRKNALSPGAFKWTTNLIRRFRDFFWDFRCRTEIRI